MFFANGVRCLFIFCVSFVQAAGKIAREEGKHDLGSTPEDSFPDNLSIPPTTAELVSNPHSSRSERGPHTHSHKHGITLQTLFIVLEFELNGMQPNCASAFSGITHNN